MTDHITFTDEAFPSFCSINPTYSNNVEAEAAPARANKTRALKNAEILTEVLYYADAETNTKFKKKDADIQVDKHINLDALGDNEDEGYYDEDDRIAQKMLAPPKVEYDEDALVGWLNRIMPRVSQILEMNYKSKAFDNYEVFWEEERGEIELWHKLQTTFDFKEANKATQKALS